MNKLRDSLIHQGPAWAAIAVALLCGWALFVSLELSQPVLF
ncbi:MAG: hypothetical protein AB7I68_10015 [Porticoccaceae bacterium]